MSMSRDLMETFTLTKYIVTPVHPQAYHILRALVIRGNLKGVFLMYPTADTIAIFHVKTPNSFKTLEFDPAIAVIKETQKLDIIDQAKELVGFLTASFAKDFSGQKKEHIVADVFFMRYFGNIFQKVMSVAFVKFKILGSIEQASLPSCRQSETFPAVVIYTDAALDEHGNARQMKK